MLDSRLSMKSPSSSLLFLPHAPFPSSFMLCFFLLSELAQFERSACGSHYRSELCDSNAVAHAARAHRFTTWLSYRIRWIVFCVAKCGIRTRALALCRGLSSYRMLTVTSRINGNTSQRLSQSLTIDLLHIVFARVIVCLLACLLSIPPSSFSLDNVT